MTRIFSAAVVTTLLGGTAFAQTAEAPAAPSSGLKISMFADAYYNYSTSKNSATQPGHRAYSAANGFSLSFLGIDTVYETEHFGATASLRFGPSVPIFYGRGTEAGQLGLGIENILQAFGTWKPTSSLKIDVGQFGTIFGAEVAESWKNLNYTRGGLYYAMQPFWHTGVRAAAAVSDELTLTGMVVNGANNIVDSGDETPSVALQGAYAMGDVAVILGYMGSLDPEADFFDHFVDLVATAAIGNLSLVFNADYGMNTKRVDSDGNALDDGTWYGASLAGGLGLTDQLGVALRGEYLGDPDGLIWGAEDNYLITGTVTLEYKPYEAGNLVIRLDNRFEKSDAQIFANRDGEGTDTWFQSVLGLVVHTD